MNPIDTNRIANALERIAQALEHFNIEHAHIDEICLLYTSDAADE